MLTKNQLGLLYMFLSVCTFSIMDLLVKWSGDYPTGQVLFFRGFFGLLPTYFLIPRDQLRTFYKTKRPTEHIFRCVMGLIALLAIVILSPLSTPSVFGVYVNVSVVEFVIVPVVGVLM